MDSAPVLNLLILARAFVEAGWCKRSYAKAGRKKVYVFCPTADRYCASGALSNALHETGSDLPLDRVIQLRDLAFAILKSVTGVHGAKCLEHWNDAHGRKQTDVLALFDQACERVGGK